MLSPTRMCVHGVFVRACLRERDHEYLRLRACVCASARMFESIRARLRACVNVCAHALVCVRSGVCKGERVHAPARIFESIRARMHACVNVYRVFARVRVHARVFVRACRCMRVRVCNERDSACLHVCVYACVGFPQRDGLSRVL